MKRFWFVSFLLVSLGISLKIQGQNNEIIKLQNQIKIIQKQIFNYEDSIRILQEKIDSIKYVYFSKSELSSITIISTPKCDIRREPNSIAKTIKTAFKDDTITVVGYIDSYYKVIIDEGFGYVYHDWIKENEEISIYRKMIEKKQEQKEKQIQQAEQRKQEEKQKRAKEIRRQKLIEKYGKIDGTKIFEGKIWIGITKEMVIDSWGKPSDINRTVDSWGVREQWVYRGSYLYFENGKLTSWQD